VGKTAKDKHPLSGLSPFEVRSLLVEKKALLPHGYKLPYMQWYEDDFKSSDGVDEMEPLARLMYRQLLAKAWVSKDAPYLPNDKDKLMRLADCPDEITWKKHGPSVVAMFKKTENKKSLYHQRQMSDYTLQIIKIVTNSKNGGLGGRPPKPEKTNDQGETERIPTGNPIERQPELEPEPALEPKPERESEPELDGAKPETDPLFLENEDTDNMNPVREIPKIAAKILHIEVKAVYPSDANRLKELTAVHGGTRVVNDFTEWCEENVGAVSKPVPEYLKVASDRLRGAASPLTDKAVVDATREMTYISGNTVLFNDRQKAAVSRLIQDGNTGSELEVVFKEFFQQLDTSNPKNLEFAAKNFIEAADAMCYTRRKQQHVRLSEQAAVDSAREIMEAQGVSDREARRKAREEELELVEDVLE
jgi:hypothetical protein